MAQRLCVLIALAAAMAAAQQVEDTPLYPAARTGGSYMHSYYLPGASSTPWRPAWSPDGREITFAMSGSI